MKHPKYDIFISYRRDGGAQYARTLQLMLEKKGYRVFLDYDELVDEKFSPQIAAAIKSSTIYMILLTKGSMARCANEGDWVRRELEIAIENGKRIVPVNPDGSFDGVPDTVPPRIKSTIEETQYSEINFGQALNATVDLMVNKRIKPYIHHTSRIKWSIAFAAILITVATGWSIWQHKNTTDVIAEIESLKLETTFQGNNISWPEDISKQQLIVIGEIFNNMQLIEGGEFLQGAEPLADGSYHENVEVEFETPAHRVAVETFYMSKFEVSVGQWNAIMNDSREGDPNIPISSVTFNQATAFAKRLHDLTGIDFRLPTEPEWEYAAKGGQEPENFMYAGSDKPNQVAWYAKNSGGKSHANIQGDLPETGTIDDLFNMSGNVSEWCNTEFLPYDDSVLISEERTMVTRGGNFDSEEYGITVTHRTPALPTASYPTLGFRLAIDK